MLPKAPSFWVRLCPTPQRIFLRHQKPRGNYWSFIVAPLLHCPIATLFLWKMTYILPGGKLPGDPDSTWPLLACLLHTYLYPVCGHTWVQIRSHADLSAPLGLYSRQFTWQRALVSSVDAVKFPESRWVRVFTSYTIAGNDVLCSPEPGLPCFLGLLSHSYLFRKSVGLLRWPRSPPDITQSNSGLLQLPLPPLVNQAHFNP